MIEYDPAVQAMISAGTVAVRDFLWLEPKDRDTGARVGRGFWSDTGAVTAEVLSPVTGLVESRAFSGGGGFIEVGDVVRSSGLTVQTVSITLGQLDVTAETVVRTYDLRLAPVEIYRGWFDPVGMTMVAPARARFTGFVDEAPITTPKAGAVGSIKIKCASYTQELTRASSERRSDASQRQRNAGDAFFQDVGVVRTWKVWWGQAPG